MDGRNKYLQPFINLVKGFNNDEDSISLYFKNINLKDTHANDWTKESQVNFCDALILSISY